MVWKRLRSSGERRCFFQSEVAVRRDSPPCFHMLMRCQHEEGLKYPCDVLLSTSQFISFITFPVKAEAICRIKQIHALLPVKTFK